MTEQTKGTTSPMNTGAFKRVFSVLVVLLLASVLMVGAVSAEDGGSTPATVTSYAELVQNLSQNVDIIILGGHIEAPSPILINYSVTIDGQYNTITVGDSISSVMVNGHTCTHLLCASEDATAGYTITLKNITFDNNGKAKGIQFLNSSENNGAENIVLTNVLVNGSSGSGISAKSVTLTATNLTVQNSKWGQSIDMQTHANNAAVGTTLQLDTTSYNSGLQDLTKISCEDPTIAGTVYVNEQVTPETHQRFAKGIYISGVKQADTYGFERRVWASTENYETSAYNTNYVVQVKNSTDAIPALHTSLADALSTYTAEGATVTLLQDTPVESAVKITTKGITFNGNGNTLTSIDTNNESVMSVEADEVTVQNLIIDDTARSRTDATSVLFLGTNTGNEKSDITVTGVTIKAGESSNHRSTGIVVGAKNVTLDGNTITLGVSKREDTTKQRNESIGIRVWTYASGDENLVITNNVIERNTSQTNPQIGILFDDLLEDSSATITNNTFDLGAGHEYTAVLEVMTTQTTAPVLNIDFIDNNVTSAKNWLYVARDNATEANVPYTVSLEGNIYNNDFSVFMFDTTNPLFIKNTTNAAFTVENAKWNATSATLIEGTNHNSWYTDQKYVAGNWWGSWSADRLSETGYLALSAKDTALPVADLMPLVGVGTPAPVKTLVVTGNLSLTTGETETISATLGGMAGEFTWAISNNAVATLSASTGSSVVLTAVAVGAADLTVTAADGTKKNVTITVTAGPVTPEIPGTPAIETTEIATGGTNTTLEFTNDIDTSSITVNPQNVTVTDGEQYVMVIKGDAVTKDSEKKINITNFTVVEMVITQLSALSPEAANADDINAIGYSLVFDLENLSVVQPEFSEEFNQSIYQSIADEDKHKPLAMVTAKFTDAAHRTAFNSNISDDSLHVVFAIDGNHEGKKFKIIHIGDGTPFEFPVTPLYNSDDDVTVIATPSNLGFSSYVLVEDISTDGGNGGAGNNNYAGGSGSSSSGSSTWLDPTQTPTDTPTEQPTDKPTDTVPTDIPGTQPTATPASPGFGILAALAGLGAVAVLRRQ